MAYSRSKSTHRNDIYKDTKHAISETLKQFTEFTNLLNEVCNQANVFGRMLQTLEEATMPEIIGGPQVSAEQVGKFKSNAHLMSSLDSFSKIMIAYSEKIKTEAIDTFDNFIIQAVAPSDDEIRGVHEHNSQIVNEFRESFFSLYNHFLILAAELMEKFLLCNNCSSPIGFPHQPLCLTKSLTVPSFWRKTNYDDKFITYGMNFCFNDLISPGCRKNILKQIANLCQKHNQAPKSSMLYSNKNWPLKWTLCEKERKEKLKPVKTKIVHEPSEVNRPFFNDPVWKPKSSETHLLQSQGASVLHRPFTI